MNLKKVEKAKKPVNRKALLLLFFATGLGSLFFWWRGRVIRETPPERSEIEKEIEIEKITPKPEGRVQRSLGEERLVEQLKEITATASGRYAIYVYRPGDKSSYGFNQTERMPAASIMKVPVMAAVWRKIARGELNLSDVYTLDEADRSIGSGPLQFKPAGSKYTVEELLTYLGKNSDNTAWVMFNRRLGKQTMEEMVTEMRMKNSSYGDLAITAEDTAKMFEYIYNGRAGGEKSREAIFGYLTESIYEDRIPAGISLRNNWQVLAHKVGTDAGVWADAGILELKQKNTDLKKEDIILVILNQEIKRGEASLMIPDLVERICGFEEKWSETR